MAKRGDTVVMDANAIIECFRLKCWKQIANGFSLQTTRECVVECATGDRWRRDYIEVNVELVKATATVHAVSESALHALQLRLGSLSGIDPGEAEILVSIMEDPAARLVCSPDKGCLRGLNILGLLDCSVALEELGTLAGLRPDWRFNFTKDWLSNFRRDLFFEGL